MLIFDRFPTDGSAQAFCSAARSRFAVTAKVYRSQAASNQVDPFPYVLTPPIVLVSRGRHERELERLASLYGGTFAGT